MPPTPLFAYSIEWISVCESALQTQRDNRTCTHTVRTITIHTAKLQSLSKTVKVLRPLYRQTNICLWRGGKQSQ